MPTPLRPGRSGALASRMASAALAWTLVVLAGCASGPRGRDGPADGATTRPGPFDSRDGPGANPPADLDRVPDAEPRVEPIRPGGPNKPYAVSGQQYVPFTQDRPFRERGLASWYGRKFQGRRTSSGELYNMYAMTAAHPTLPIPSYARIRNPANGREIVVRVNDRGPFHSSRIVDLSYTAALKLDVLRGVSPVELERITFEDIRTGAWRRDGAGDSVRVASARAAIGRESGREIGVADGPPVAVPAPAAAGPSGVEPVPSPVSAGGAGAAGPSPLPNAAEPASATVAVGAPATVVAGPSPAPITDAPPARAFTEPARGFWIQLGAFRQRDGAEGFQRRIASELDWLSPLLAVFGDSSMFRLQAGPYPSRDEARSVAERVRGVLQLVPVIVERR